MRIRLQYILLYVESLYTLDLCMAQALVSYESLNLVFADVYILFDLLIADE